MCSKLNNPRLVFIQIINTIVRLVFFFRIKIVFYKRDFATLLLEEIYKIITFLKYDDKSHTLLYKYKQLYK